MTRSAMDKHDISASLVANLIGAVLAVLLVRWLKRGYETRKILHGAVGTMSCFGSMSKEVDGESNEVLRSTVRRTRGYGDT